MRSVVLALLCSSILAVSSNAGEEMEIIAVGRWSEWTDGLRGRLLLLKGRTMVTRRHRETLVLLELENALGSGKQLDVYFEPDRVKCELADARGAAVGEHKITEGQRKSYQRRRAKNAWVTLPDSAALRLRVNPCCAGEEEHVALFLLLNDKTWLIKAKDAGDYFLSGTFTASPPPAERRANAWQGTLKLPGMKIRWQPNRKADQGDGVDGR